MALSRKRKITAWVCLAVALGMLLHPPWFWRHDKGYESSLQYGAGYDWIWAPPPPPPGAPPGDEWNAAIRWERLLVQWLVVLLLFRARGHVLPDRRRAPMEEFGYVAWFRTADVPLDDQDSEWCACFVVVAANSAAAQRWGDHLSRRMCSRNPRETFLWSRVDTRAEAGCSEEAWLEEPRVQVGEVAADKKIGW